MDSFLLTGAAQSLVFVLGAVAALFVLIAYAMRDQDTLKGPVLALLVTTGFAVGAYVLHGAVATARAEATQTRLEVLSDKYGVKIRPGDDVSDVTTLNRWRVGKFYRLCHLMTDDLADPDPTLVCQFEDSQTYEIPTAEQRSKR